MKHMRFKKIDFNNRKKIFILEYTSGLVIECPYFSFGIKHNIVDAGTDREVGNHSFYFILENGYKDYVPFDQPLHIVQNPDYILEETLYKMTGQLNKFIVSSRISKRQLARLLKTSVSQLNRILDPANYKKDIGRLIEIAALLNYEFLWDFKKAA
jgi:hypothetical protein